MNHLDPLEAEAIHVIREVAAELERPVVLFSGGKDSIVLHPDRRCDERHGGNGMIADD